MQPITLEEHAETVAAELHAHPGQFNGQKAGPKGHCKFVLRLRDERGALAGGLVSEKVWNTLYVGLLWVREVDRGRGYGKALMEQAEQLAKEHGCDVMLLNTWSFQAPEF